VDAAETGQPEVTIESTIYDALKVLVGPDDRVFPDNAPAGTTTPYITFQQVGGSSINFLEGSDPGKGIPRFQVNVWSKTRAESKALMKQAATALRAVAALQTTVEGEPTAVYEEDTELHGMHQDFSFIE
jgi:hypothetical protein